MNLSNIIWWIYSRGYPKPRNAVSWSSSAVCKFPRRLRGTNYISVGRDTTIDSNAWIEAIDKYANVHYSPELRIGERCRIGRGVIITCIGLLEIGDKCLFSEQVYISDHSHGVGSAQVPPYDQELRSKGNVKIGNSCFIGIRAAILPGAGLGHSCIVGANSVVTKRFPDNSVLAGAPARIIGRTGDPLA